MKISMNARKATRTKGRGRIRGTNHKQNYVRWGRAYYVKNRSRILRRARERYRKNRRKYAKIFLLPITFSLRRTFHAARS